MKMGSTSSRFYGVVVALMPCAALGQTGEEPALPHLEFPMPASAYPLDAIVANQEGTTIIELMINEEGAVTSAEIREPTGYPLLDQIALANVRAAHLSTPLVDQNGVPTAARVLADVTWKLPLESAEMYMIEELPGADEVGPGDIVEGPSEGDYDNRITARDYPATSIRRRETGLVLTRVLINAEGAVEDARLGATSGFDELDEAALAAVMRFQYNPGKINGEPARMWVNVPIRYAILGVGVSNCVGAPAITADERRNVSAEGDANYERWTLVTRDGTIGESLILTEQGWMRFTPALVEYMNQNANFPRLGSGRTATLPSNCWLYDGVNPMMQSTQPDLPELPDAPPDPGLPPSSRPPDLMSNPIDGGLYTRSAVP